ncbi:hypothetical protein C6P40_004592 [Pichia californica]|uniref:DNA helicase Pif1-like 2B domain-containing protein n=1 Tax=Pichia californica TaxID=460514 RepID=A0A9P6WG40_9ASCO|nr:hypothetical protein C6P40_004592 [[Candida] californica]
MRLLHSANSKYNLKKKKKQAEELINIGSGFNIENGIGIEDLSVLNLKKTQFMKTTHDEVNNMINKVCPEKILHSCKFLKQNENNYKSDLNLLINHYSDNCIVTPKNIDVENINKQMLNRIDNEEKILISHDESEEISDNENSPQRNWYPTINRYYDTTFPKHQLKLKIGSPVMLLRNLDT